MFARAILAASLFTAKALAADPTFPYGQEKVRGVNLGGWLVLEPFITPSLFDRTANDAIVDEFTFGGLQDHDFALSALKKHWDTWITEDDFADIAAAGLNHVRLPVGFWAWDVLDSEPYIQGQLPYVRKAVKWARNHGLKIVLDLHGAPGSQNGFDNSGQRLSGGPEWNKNQTNIDRTSAVIKQIVAEFAADVDTIPTIAPLNEPAGYFSDDLLSKTKAYWKDSYANIRNPNGKADTNIVELIHDAFQDINSWTGFMPESKYPNVAIDVHKYQIFSDAEVNRTEDEHIDFACETGRTLSTFTDNPVIVGEWSTAYTDCAKWLNGRGKGARYDGTFSGETAVGSCDGFTGPASKLSEETKTFMRKYWEAQVTAWEMVDGWIQWTWKTESAADWSYQAGLKGGWIPQDPTERKYGNLCAKTNAVVQII